MPDPQKAIEEIKRVVKENGLIICPKNTLRILKQTTINGYNFPLCYIVCRSRKRLSLKQGPKKSRIAYNSNRNTGRYACSKN